MNILWFSTHVKATLHSYRSKNENFFWFKDKEVEGELNEQRNQRSIIKYIAEDLSHNPGYSKGLSIISCPDIKKNWKSNKRLRQGSKLP
jgi:hypothetical protein